MTRRVIPIGTTTLLEQSIHNEGEISYDTTLETIRLGNGVAVGGVAQPTAATLAASGGADDIGFIQAGTGAVARTLQDKGRDVVNVKDFGAVGDGVTNDTAAIQAAITATTVGAELFFPAGNYLTGNLIVLDKTNLKINGGGLAKLTLTGTAATGIGLQLSGNCSDLEICGLHFIGDGVVANRHSGVWSNSEATKVFERIDIHHNYFDTVVVGVSLTRNAGGIFRNSSINDNKFYDIVGIQASEGYAIVVTNENITTTCNVLICRNHIDGAGRHAIYVGRVSGAVVQGNIVKNHRAYISGAEEVDAVAGLSFPVPSIIIQRSRDVIVDSNFISDGKGGAIAVGADPESAGFVSGNIIISNNMVIRPVDNLPLFYCGWHSSANGIEDAIQFVNNVVYVNAVGILDGTTRAATAYAPPVFKYVSGKQVSWVGGRITVLNCNATTVPDYPPAGLTAGTGGLPPSTTNWAPFWLDTSISSGAVEGDNIVIKDVDIHITMAAGTAAALYSQFNFNNRTPKFTSSNIRMSGNLSKLFHTDSTVNNVNMKIQRPAGIDTLTNANVALFGYSAAPVQVLNVAITAARTLTPSLTGMAYPGMTFKIVRTAAATGAFAYNIGTTGLSLDPGEWCEITFGDIGAGNVWSVTGFGTLA